MVGVCRNLSVDILVLFGGGGGGECGRGEGVGDLGGGYMEGEVFWGEGMLVGDGIADGMPFIPMV